MAFPWIHWAVYRTQIAPLHRKNGKRISLLTKILIRKYCCEIIIIICSLFATFFAVVWCVLCAISHGCGYGNHFVCVSILWVAKWVYRIAFAVFFSSVTFFRYYYYFLPLFRHKSAPNCRWMAVYNGINWITGCNEAESIFLICISFARTKLT